MSEREPSSTAVAVDDEPCVSTQAGQSVATPSDRARRAPLTEGGRRWLVVILAIAAIVRIVWLAYAHVAPPVWYIPSGDSFSYWHYANEIAQGHGYVSYTTGEATAYYPIGFPAVLAGVYWLANHTPLVDPDLMLVTGVFQIAISVATVALTFVVGRRLIGPRGGLVAAAVMALFPNLIYQVTTIQVETTFIFFTMAALAIIVDHDWSTGPPSRNRLVAFGSVLAISALVRPFSIPLVLGLLLAVLATGIGWRRALLLVSVPVLVLVAAFAPWTIRNAVELGAFVPSSTNMGDTLCIDRNSEADGGFRWSVHDGCVDPDLPEVERNRGNTRKAIQFVADNPGRELLQIARRGQFMFRDDHDGIIATEGLGSGKILSDSSRALYTTIADWYFYVVLAVGVVGLPLMVRRAPRPERRLVLAISVALLVIPLLLWGNPRFHQPLVPFLALSIGALVSAVAARLVARQAESPPTSATPDDLGEPAPVVRASH